MDEHTPDGCSEEAAPISTLKDQPLVENEPYLGPAWAVAMLILYLLKEAFPAEPYTAYWWFQMYVVGLVVVITLFTLIKRHQFYSLEAEEQDALNTGKPDLK